MKSVAVGAFGSVIALLAYPLLIEPAIGLSAQTKAWRVGFGILGALIAMSGILRLLNCSRNKAADLKPTAPTQTDTRTIRSACGGRLGVALLLGAGASLASTPAFVSGASPGSDHTVRNGDP